MKKLFLFLFVSVLSISIFAGTEKFDKIDAQGLKLQSGQIVTSISTDTDLTSSTATDTQIATYKAIITNIEALIPSSVSSALSAAIGSTIQAYNANYVVDASYVHTDNNLTTALINTWNGKQPAGSYELSTNKELTALDTDTQKYPNNAVVNSAVNLKVDKDFSGYTAEASPASGMKLLINNAGTSKVIDWDDLPGAASGEANTASNVGTAGVGVFKQKSGVDLEFKKINAGSSSVTITDDTGNNEIDIDVAAASDTLAGKVELATAAETTTGTDTTRAVTPDGLSGSEYGKRGLGFIVIDFTTDVTTGDGKSYSFPLPACYNGMNLVSARAGVITAGTTNATTIMVHNETDNTDMLSAAISIASGDKAGTGTVNASYDDVVTNDVIRIDVDSVSTTAPKGLTVALEFQLP